jgi:NAD(P)-dependent dehydrogenase (short-subunit alcohol dehydrogenase family)
LQTLKDKTAVVTGAGSGIGRSIALALADNGANVIVADIQEATADAVAKEVGERGVRSLAVKCDVSLHDSVTGLADRAYTEFGSVDVLCNNAGISWRPYRSVLDATLDDWKLILGINLWGVIHGLDVFLPRMRKQVGEKHIVNTASLAGLVPHEGHAPYSASKAGVVGLSEAIAGELAPYGFGVTIFVPGAIPTNLGENTNRIHSEKQGSAARTFEPVSTPVMDRVKTFALSSVDPIGAMVCKAILANTLYLHSAAVPGDLVADRIHTQYGGSTLVG